MSKKKNKNSNKSRYKTVYTTEDYQRDADAFNKAIEDAEKANIKGKDTTPFLLKAIADATKGKSLEANIALIYNNAHIGSLIAKEYSKLK